MPGDGGRRSVATVTQGQSGATSSITVGNPGLVSIVGTVTVTYQLEGAVPNEGAVTSISGAGWSCLVLSATCARTDSLPPGSSYPTITVTANTSGMAVAQAVEDATVSGGGAVPRPR